MSDRGGTGRRPARGRALASLRSLAAGARRIVSNAEVAPDPARIAGGWELRFIADRSRAEEAIRLYGELGFEVAADSIAPENLPRDCADCRLVMALQFRAIYTRRRPQGPPAQ
jgi:hypothetical protein